MPENEEMLYFKFFSFNETMSINIYTDVVCQNILIFNSSTHLFVASIYLIILQNRRTEIQTMLLDAFRSYRSLFVTKGKNIPPITHTTVNHFMFR
jgi:hypothetical protein